MSKLKLLPAAAGIIALTATLGLSNEQRENEGDNISRSKITLTYAQAGQVPVHGIPPDSQFSNISRSPTTMRPAYLVEINRGDSVSKVMIDAVTGRILATNAISIS
ncbi:MAG: hypothetical protein GC149_12745 [Gammaproteobacteria bacterium]|nr:hypothetical protein [Gammaproteobacteria bacterium]